MKQFLGLASGRINSAPLQTSLSTGPYQLKDVLVNPPVLTYLNLRDPSKGGTMQIYSSSRWLGLNY